LKSFTRALAELLSLAKPRLNIKVRQFSLPKKDRVGKVVEEDVKFHADYEKISKNEQTLLAISAIEVEFK
jgi:hypothetical protein